MNNNDVYEQWKRQRSSIEPPSGFESEVMAQLVEANVETDKSQRKTTRLLDHPVWAAAAVLAASIVGVLRVAFALFIGIQT